MPPINHQGSSRVTLATTRMKRAVSFYESVLGFKVTRQLTEPSWCEMSCGDIHIGIAEVQNLKPGQTTLTIYVENLLDAISELKAHKVEHSAISEVQSIAKLVTFDDPEGNPLMFRQDI